MRKKCKNWPHKKEACRSTCRDCKCNYRCRWCRDRLDWKSPRIEAFMYRIKHSETCYRTLVYKGRFCDETCLELVIKQYEENPKIKWIKVLNHP